MMKRTYALLAAVALAAAACGGGDDPGSGEAGDGDGGSEPIRVLYTRQPETLALFVAEEEGLFDDRGLDVTLEEAGPDSQTGPAVLGGSYELGHSTASAVILAASEGQDLVFATGGSVSTPDNNRVFLTAGSSSGVTEVEDLEGKRIGVPGRGGFAELGFAIVLENHGVDPASVTWVPLGFPQMNDALTQGTVDAVVAVPPFSMAMTRSGHVEVIDASELGESLILAVLTARREWAEDNADALYEFRAALAEAADLIAEDEELAREVVAQYTGLPPDVVAQMPLTTSRSEVTVDEVELWVDILGQGGVVEPDDVNAASLIVPPPS